MRNRMQRLSPRRATDGLVSHCLNRRRATDRECGAGVAPGSPRPSQDACSLAVALRGHPGEGRGHCRVGPGDRSAVRGRIPRGWVGRPAAVGRDWPGQRLGRPHRGDHDVADGGPGANGGRSLRPDCDVDRPAAWSDPGPAVPGRTRVPLAAGAGDPGTAQKNLPEHVREQREFLDTELKPRLDAAVAGHGHVLFVDAAHFVYGTFLCCLWSVARVFVRAASGRQRFNVLGAWNAVARELIAVTNTTVVNTDTMCDLLRAVAARGLMGPVTLVLDNARYQRNAVVKGLAAELGIGLLFLPAYSPNLNLIERLWRFMKRKAAYGRYHPTFAAFRAAVQDVLDRVPTTHANKLASLMTLNFQEFDNVSLLAA